MDVRLPRPGFKPTLLGHEGRVLGDKFLKTARNKFYIGYDNTSRKQRAAIVVMIRYRKIRIKLGKMLIRQEMKKH